MGLVKILEGIGNKNIVWYCNYNRNHRRGSRGIGIGIRNKNIIGIWLRFWYMFENI